MHIRQQNEDDARSHPQSRSGWAADVRGAQPVSHAGPAKHQRPTHTFAQSMVKEEISEIKHTLKRMRTNVRKIVRRSWTAKGSSQHYMLSLNMRSQKKT